MAFTQDWKDADELLPTDSEQVKLGPDKIRDFKVAVRERLQIDHEFGEAQSGVDTGFHKRVTLKKVAGGATEAVAGYNELAYNSSNGFLTHFPEGGAQHDLVDDDTAQNLTNKTLTGSTINEAGAITDQGGGAANRLKLKVVAIGTWDMVATGAVTIVHGVTESKIRAVDVLIIGDDGRSVPLDHNSTGTQEGGRFRAETTGGITLTRFGTGYFIDANFNGAGNRGYISIWYEA